MKALEPGFYVAGQIAAEEIAMIAAAGVRMIVNNRPDDEEAGQPSGAEIAAAAAAAGLAYRHIPVAQLSGDQVQNMAAALEAAEGPVLAFCRSGTRSTYLWALARAAQGTDAESLIEQATAAGYDLTPIARFL